jgi:glucose-6-phosphate dehydrogenase assembly protein OpcA
MATAVADRTWRDSSPETIEADLAALWRDLARDAPVVRSLMANLVIFLERPASEHVDLSAPIDDVPVDEVSRRHPSRVILLHHARGTPEARRPIAAAIGALTFGPPRARNGIEQIAVRSTCAEASLPSIVRRLVLGDLPTSLWWTEDLSEAAPLAALVAMARQLVYDSRRWHDVRQGVLALAPLLPGGHQPSLVDLNWRRLTPMRQAILHALGSVRSVADMRLAGGRIRHRPGDGALAWLLAGWLSSRLESTADPRAPVLVDEAPGGDEILTVSFADTSMTATMNEHRVIVSSQDDVAPFVVAAPREAEADAVVSELRSLAHDICLRDALTALSRRFSRG